MIRIERFERAPSLDRTSRTKERGESLVLRGWSRLISHQSFDARAKRIGDALEEDDGNVARAGLELRQVALRDAGSLGELLARHVFSHPRRAHATANDMEEIRRGQIT